MKQETKICGWVLENDGKTMNRETILQPGQPTTAEGLCKAPAAMTLRVDDVTVNFCEYHAGLVLGWIAKDLGV